MSITDELRGYANTRISPNKGMLTAIADRIDTEYEKAIRELNNLADACVLLPKDADGEYIRIGDVMRFGGIERDLTVLGIGIYGECDHDMGVFVREGDDYVWYNARFLRHYHAPTVEDVLTEFGIDWEHESDCEDRAALLREYAAKLQLREDA